MATLAQVRQEMRQQEMRQQELREEEQKAQTESAALKQVSDKSAETGFRVPKIPAAGKVEELASSLDLDISQLMKEVKAWTR